MQMMTRRSVVMLGATGAVGGEALKALLAMPEVARITLLGRRLLALPAGAEARVSQQVVDVGQPSSYAEWVAGHDAAICTLGVGQPSQMTTEAFLRVDRDWVIAFATACRERGVRHFELLGAVGANSRSRSLYLRTKGELRDALIALRFERLSLFQPSMILTPTNRYGLSQAITLALWPALSHLMIGPMRQFRGVRVEVLGGAMARNLVTAGSGVETLQWADFMRLSGPSSPPPPTIPSA